MRRTRDLTPTRTLTLDSRRYRQLFRGLLTDVMVSPPSLRALALCVLLGVASGWFFESWFLTLWVVVAGSSTHVLSCAQYLRKLMRQGLGVGQTVTTGYADSAEFTVTDVTGQTWLPRGSALQIIRSSDRVRVVGRVGELILPRELITEADLAYLQGQADQPPETTAPAPTLPLRLEMTPQVQAQLVSSITRTMVTSADFLMPYLAAACLIGLAALTGSGPFIVAMVVFGVAWQFPWLRYLGRARQHIRATYPLGTTIRAQVTPEHLVISVPEATQLRSWDRFCAHRLTHDVVLLRGNRRRARSTAVFPRALFTEPALEQLTSAVPRTF